MPINYTQLKTELQTDPQALGYAALVSAGNDQALADAMNQVRSGVPFQVDKGFVPSSDVFEAIVGSEFEALAQAKRDIIMAILSMGQVNLQGTRTRASFAQAFAAGTQSRSNLAALQTRQGSRGEILFGSGTVIQHGDIARALRAT